MLDCASLAPVALTDERTARVALVELGQLRCDLPKLDAGVEHAIALQQIRDSTEHSCQRLRSQGEGALASSQTYRVAVEVQREMPALQAHPILLGQNWQEQLVR